MFSADLVSIDQLRADAINVQEPHQSGIVKIIAYAAQLVWLGGKFPVDIGVEFSWFTSLGLTRASRSQNMELDIQTLTASPQCHRIMFVLSMPTSYSIFQRYILSLLFPSMLLRQMV